MADPNPEKHEENTAASLSTAVSADRDDFHMYAISHREYVTVKTISWIISIALNICAFFIAGLIVDYMTADFEIEMDWGSEPLTGFGMMADVIDETGQESVEPPPVDEDEDPFEQTEDEEPSPSLDPDSIVEPEEPEIDESKPLHDLSRDRKKLAAVRADVASMPNLHVLAPGNARLIVLIRNDRVAGSIFESSLRRLFRAFPDYRFTLGSSEIDPIYDIRALLIATSNPKYYSDTFLVVSHAISEKTLRRNIEQSFPTRLTWQKFNGRPLAVPDRNDGRYAPNSGLYSRSLYFADDNTILFLRPEVLPSLNAAHVDAAVKVRDKDLEKNPHAKQTFMQSLGGLADADSVSAPTLFFMVQGIDGIRLGRGFPDFKAPRAIIASMSSDEKPHLNLQATFENEDSAEKFVEIWPQIVSAASGMGVPGVGALLKSLALTPEGDQILVAGDLNGSMINLVLMFASRYLERND